MTLKAGVIGDPISHSLSPKLHNYFLEKYNINGKYNAIHVKPENLEQDFDNLLEQQNFEGFNITLPHKEKVFEICKKRGYSLTDSARSCEAVNTVYKFGDQICGSNSDSYGFEMNLRLFLPEKKAIKTALILGAGGAARSAIFSLLNNFNCQKIYIINRSPERAQNIIKMDEKKLFLAQNINETIGSELDLIVNTTSLGMKNQPELKIDLTNLNKSAIVYDIVYNPLMTNLLQDAKSRGNPIATGIGMLIFQALEGFEKWFKLKPELTKNDFEKLIKNLT